MKSTLKTVSIFIVCAILLSCVSFSTLAIGSGKNDVANNISTVAYVSDVYKEDPSYALKVQQKQETAMNYYQATISGNIELANKYKDEFDRISNPMLYQSKISQSETRGATDAGMPSSWRISGLYQVPQEKSYWCGCAAAKSILDSLGIVKTQAQLASDTYLKTERFGNTPWYISNGNDFSQFPMATTLRDAQYEVSNTAFGYVPSPLGAAGANPLTVDECKAYVMSTTYSGYGVAACGVSKATNDNYHLPGYPASDVGHWIVSDGYLNNGNSIWIIDPAKSSVVSWSNNISAYYNISATKFRNFIQPRGIIW